MTEDDVYTFHLEAYSPATIPMSRLAEYMAQLAQLFGHHKSVHFEGLTEGSVNVQTRVEKEAVTRVRSHVQEAVSGSNVVALKAYRTLNEMLRQDNAAADLLLASAKVLSFPGRKEQRPTKIGPFWQETIVEGVLVRIGGKDKTAHAILKDSRGVTHSFEISRELARTLAPYLFGQPVRIIGTGRWVRNEDGDWEVTSQRGARFEPLQDEMLAAAIVRLRAETAPLGLRDALGKLKEFRDGSDEVH